MYQTARIRFSLDGELARALSWEAARRNVEVQDLVLRLVRGASRQILTQFRHVHEGVRFLEDRRRAGDSGGFREVVQKALGPSRS